MNTGLLLNPYRFGGSGWTYETDFSASTGWTTTDSSKLNIASGALDFLLNASSQDNEIYYDHTTISDTAFVFRWKLVFSTLANNGTAGQAATNGFIVSDTMPVSGESPSGSDAIQFHVNSEAGSLIGTFLKGYNGGTGLTNDYQTDDPWINAGTKYGQLIRLSATTAEGKYFGDSAYSSQDGTTLSVTDLTNVINLRYGGFRIFTQTVSGGTLQQGTYDDYKFANAVTTPP